MLYSDTYHADTTAADGVVVIPAKERSCQFPVTATVCQHSYSAVRQSSANQGKAASSERYADLAVKRRQIGLKRKSLQEMRHLLNTATITVFMSVYADS